MLKRYKDFIFESLINESIVVFSDRFKGLLKNIDSPVSKALQEIEGKDYTVANNFIDIDDDKEKFSFIPDRRAQDIIKPENREKYAYHQGDGGFLTHNTSNATIFGLLEYEPVGDKCYHPSSSEKGEVLKKVVSPTSGKTYVKIQFPGGISVINQDRIRYEDVSKLPFSQNRQSIRLGRGIRGILNAAKLQFSDAEIEQFVNKYKSEFDKMNDIFRLFEVVEGDLISHWYNYKNYAMSKGQLSNSCMSAVPPRYFQIYTKNPEVCKLVILKTEEGDKIMGRALLWKLTSPDVWFMDRIYTHNDSDIELFRQYAKFKKWNYKKFNQSSSETNMVSPDGTEVSPDELTTTVKSGGYDSYPYLDTLKYYNKSSGELTTSDEGYNGGRGSNVSCLEDTGGGTVDESGCDYCDGSGRVDCDECDGSGTTQCSECDGRGEVNCDQCDGEGEVDCPKCDGEGEDKKGNKCDQCEGKGKIECEDCDGDGEVECSNCSGDGEVECGECGGDGRRDCPECNW